MKDKFKKLEQKIIESYDGELTLSTANGLFRLEIDSSKVTLSEFIHSFLYHYNNTFPTCDKNKKVTTPTGKRRSLGDIYMICRSYFPDVTLKDVLRVLCFITESRGYRSSYCYQINKRVWYYSKTKMNAVYDKNKTDEWGHRYSYYMKEFLKENEEAT